AKDPYDQFCRVSALHAFRNSPPFAKLYEVYKRAKGQIAQGTAATLDPSLFQEEAEKTLYTQYESIKPPFDQALADKAYKTCFTHLASLQGPLSTLFDEVKILADDQSVQQNR